MSDCLLIVSTASADWSGRMVMQIADFGAVVIFAGFLLSLVRLVRGPHLADRAIALDTIAIHLIAVVILFTMRVDSLVLFDGVLVLSLLGFAGTIAVSHYIVRPHVRRRMHGAAADDTDI